MKHNIMKDLYNPSSWLVKATIAALLISVCTQLHATGFSTSEYIGSSSLGRSGAGGAAIADDATTVFTNPAGMTRLSGSQWLVATQFFMPTINFHNGTATKDAAGVPISGGDGGNAGVFVTSPSFYYVNSLSKQWFFGFGINSPFGLAVDYNDDWVGRYKVTNAEIKTINLNPSIAFKVNDALSIGGGLNLQYAQYEFNSALDLGALMGVPQSADGQIKLDGDDWGWGFNFGLLWTLDASNRVGIAYRSKIKYNIQGDADFTTPNNLFQPLFTDTKFNIPITVPEHISFSFHHQLNPRLAVMSDVTYTRWSRYKQLQVNYDNPNQPDTVVSNNWHNTWRIAMGLDYTYSKPWSFQFGVAVDQSPIPDETFNPSVPSNDQGWFSLGTQYRYSDTLSLGVSYLHVFLLETRDINIEYPFGGRLQGPIDGSMNVIGAELNWSF
jgi:long-chain fatty acid transport protein